ncbi:hypothetical protein [Terribacillus halophilus]|uniref:hypothetical protein n=1 Tax=Terribacillus halophilus TaxID=361279 RepID=UPI003981FD01
MRVKLAPVGQHAYPLDETVTAALETGYNEIAVRIEEYKNLGGRAAELIDFAKGELHGLKLAAHAMGYKFEEDQDA